jgi:hypothetical protein
MIRDDKIVAHGVQFNSGKCVVNWTGEHCSVVVWDSLESLMAINGHSNTKFFFSDLHCYHCMTFITPSNKHYCRNFDNTEDKVLCQDCKKSCLFCKNDTKRIVKRSST